MKEEIILSGSGGQGSLFMGKLLTYAGLQENQNVSYVPADEAEAPNTLAWCTVVISNQDILCPQVTQPTSLMVLDNTSLEKFVDTLQPGGVLVINSSLVTRDVGRDDVSIYPVDALCLSEKIGFTQGTNMVILGTFIAATKIVRPDSIMAAFKKLLPSGKHNCLSSCLKALEAGMAVADGF